MKMAIALLLLACLCGCAAKQPEAKMGTSIQRVKAVMQ